MSSDPNQTEPVVLDSIVLLRSWREAQRTPARTPAARTPKRTVAVVMTMGALHEGHLSLLRAARDRADVVIATVFVNPLQFGPGEDYERYPRTFEADKLAMTGLADAIFVPSAAEMYPVGASETTVHAGRIGANFEGLVRPGHFDGMLTVVLKLLQLVQPDLAYFGEKDAQQLALIIRMVLDFNIPTEVVGAPIVRDADGLALSSRNIYLSTAERTVALRLSRAVAAAQRAASAGFKVDYNQIRAVADAQLSRPMGPDGEGVAFEVEYAELVNPVTFEVINAAFQGAARYIVAARVGATRLLDNGTVTVGFHAGDTVNR